MAQVFGGGWADSVRLLDNQDRRHWDFRVFEAPFLDILDDRSYYQAFFLVLMSFWANSSRDQPRREPLFWTGRGFFEWPWQERFLHQGLVPRIVGHSLVQALSSVHSVHSEMMLGNCRGNDWSVTAATLDQFFFRDNRDTVSLFLQFDKRSIYDCQSHVQSYW